MLSDTVKNIRTNYPELYSQMKELYVSAIIAKFEVTREDAEFVYEAYQWASEQTEIWQASTALIHQHLAEHPMGQMAGMFLRMEQSHAKQKMEEEDK